VQKCRAVADGGRLFQSDGRSDEGPRDFGGHATDACASRGRHGDAGNEVDLRNSTPQLLTPELAAAAQFLITMGCGDECPFVPGACAVKMAADDPKGRNLEDVRRIRDEISARAALIAARDWSSAYGSGIGEELAASICSGGGHGKHDALLTVCHDKSSVIRFAWPAY
jgi:hypothetical protein